MGRSQFFQTVLQLPPGPLHLLDGEVFPVVVLNLLDTGHDLPYFILNELFLALIADGDFFKLRLSDDNGVIVPGGDAGAEFFAAGGFKILLPGDEDVGRGVQPHKFRGPLFRQVVGDYKDGFAAQAQPLALHGGGDHLKGLARAHLMGQEGVAAVQHTGHGVDLMGQQLDLRVHAGKGDMAPVILAGPGAVHFLIVLPHQGLPPLGVLPYPVPKSVADQLLLLLGQGSLFSVEYPFFFAVRAFDLIINTHIPQIQRILQNFIGVGPAGPVGGVVWNVAGGYGEFCRDIPLRRMGRVIDLDVPPQIPGGVQGFLHKLLDVLFVDPGSPQPHLNFRGVQVPGLGGGQGLHVGLNPRRLLRGQHLGHRLGHTQLPAHVAGEVFVSGDKGKAVQIGIGFWNIIGVLITPHIPEDHAGQRPLQFRLGLAGELGHVGHIHSGLFRDRDGQCLAGGVHMVHSPVGADGPLGEHIRLALQPPVLVYDLQGAQQIVGAVAGKGQPVAPVIDKAEFGGEAVVKPV